MRTTSSLQKIWLGGIVLLFAGAVGYGVWMLGIGGPEREPQLADKQTTDESASGNTYRNETLGFEVNFPDDDWVEGRGQTLGEVGTGVVTFNSKESPNIDSKLFVAVEARNNATILDMKHRIYEKEFVASISPDPSYEEIAQGFVDVSFEGYEGFSYTPVQGGPVQIVLTSDKIFTFNIDPGSIRLINIQPS